MNQRIGEPRQAANACAVIEEHYQLVVRVAVVAQTNGTANKSEQERLRLRASDSVLRVMRVRSEDGRPLAYEIVVLPLKLFPGLVSNSEIGSDTLGLARRQGLHLGLAIERVSTTGASEAVAAGLGVLPGSRVKMLDRVVSTLDGQPVEWRVAFTRDDRAS